MPSRAEPRCLVLDAGALIAVERRKTRALALLKEALALRAVLLVPAGVLAQVWRGQPTQHPIAKLLRARGLRVEPLDFEAAIGIGLLLAAFGTRDIVDGQVVALATAAGARVVTSDAGDLARLGMEDVIGV